MKLEKEVEIENYEFDCEDIKRDVVELSVDKFTDEEKDFLVKNWSKKAKLVLEVEEPILDDAERKYLSGVIRPFRDRVENIQKNGIYPKGKERIVIAYNNSLYMPFPVFKEGTMYKGMELNKEYTLEELGL